MKPTIGRIVIYHLSDDQIKGLKGKPCNTSAKLSAIITAVWSETCVNLRVITDGMPECDFWVTSVLKGDDQFNWNWPVREE